MLSNYFKTTIRYLFRQKGYSILNIIGLAVSIACCLLIFQYVAFERSYDNFSKANRIVRLRLDSYQQGKLDWQSAAVYPAFGQMKMIAGRNFSEVFPSDSGATILNETAAAMFGFGSPAEAINHKITAENGSTIIGVVQDYHTEGLQNKIDPQLMTLRLNARNVYSIKIESPDVSSSIEAVQAEWNRHFPYDPFSYYFLDEAFDHQYKSEKQFGIIFGIFAGIAIIIACVGLFGLSAYNALQRTKEIGIRKVLGASVSGIVALLSKDFIRLVSIAILLGCPIAWWAMNKWLMDFAYRIDIEWWMFAVAGLAAVVIALLTVTYQSVRAALMNPAKSLRSE